MGWTLLGAPVPIGNHTQLPSSVTKLFSESFNLIVDNFMDSRLI